MTRESAALMQVKFLGKASIRADDISKIKAEVNRPKHVCLCACQQPTSILLHRCGASCDHMKAHESTCTLPCMQPAACSLQHAAAASKWSQIMTLQNKQCTLTKVCKHNYLCACSPLSQFHVGHLRLPAAGPCRCCCPGNLRPVPSGTSAAQG